MKQLELRNTNKINKTKSNIVKRIPKENLAGYAFVVPALVFMLAIIGYPIIYNIIISFQDVSAMTLANPVREFIGLDNYKAVFSNELMSISFKNTFFYTAACLVIQFSFGFLLALFFNLKFKFCKPIRGLIVISWMLPVTVTALIFKFMLSQGSGIINDILMFLNIIEQPIGWLIEQNTAMWGLVIANSWIGIPFNMLLLTTGLANIPEDVYESASIDGANTLQKFFFITVPLIKPAIMSVLVLGFVYTFKVFDLVFVMTAGGPVNATEVLSTYSYQLSFKHYYFGQGAAVANILFVCLFFISLIYLRMIGKDEVM